MNKCYNCKKPFTLCERVWVCAYKMIGKDTFIGEANDSYKILCANCMNKIKK